MTTLTRKLLITLLAVTVLATASIGEADTFTVDRTDDDELAFGCTDATPNDCSLRGALAQANFHNPRPDTIIVPAGTYLLTRGQLTIDDDVTITGAGSATTIIQTCLVHQKTAPCPGGQGTAQRVFATTAKEMAVEIADVTIRHGRTEGDGIINAGGGIRNEEGPTLTLRRVVVADNTSETQGGGLFNRGAETLIVIDSTVSGNTADLGGGIANANGGVTHIIGSTISENSARASGGGLLNWTGSTATLENSTVSGNTADGDGGGIMNFGNTVTLRNVTITGNRALGSGADGGGVANSDAGSVDFANTIIAGNTISGNISRDCSGVLISNGHNLVQNVGCHIFVTDDLLGVDPHLGPLADNGGPTKTHALLASSPAIDAGDDLLCPAVDQRGAARPHGAHCDIGAYEVGDQAGEVIPLRIGPTRFSLGQTQGATDELVGTETFVVPQGQAIDPFTQPFELTFAEPACGGVFSRLSLPAGAFRSFERGAVAVFTGMIPDKQSDALVIARIRLIRQAAGSYRATLRFRHADYDCLKGQGGRAVTLSLTVGALTAEGTEPFRRLSGGDLSFP